MPVSSHKVLVEVTSLSLLTSLTYLTLLTLLTSFPGNTKKLIKNKVNWSLQRCYRCYYSIPLLFLPLFTRFLLLFSHANTLQYPIAHSLNNKAPLRS